MQNLVSLIRPNSPLVGASPTAPNCADVQAEERFLSQIEESYAEHSPYTDSAWPDDYDYDHEPYWYVDVHYIEPYCRHSRDRGNCMTCDLFDYEDDLRVAREQETDCAWAEKEWSLPGVTHHLPAPLFSLAPQVNVPNPYGSARWSRLRDKYAAEERRANTERAHARRERTAKAVRKPSKSTRLGLPEVSGSGEGKPWFLRQRKLRRPISVWSQKNQSRREAVLLRAELLEASLQLSEGVLE